MEEQLRQDFIKTMLDMQIGYNMEHFARRDRGTGVFNHSYVESSYKGYKAGRKTALIALTFNEVVKLVEDKVDYISSVSGILQILVDNGVLTVQKD